MLHDLIFSYTSSFNSNSCFVKFIFEITNRDPPQQSHSIPLSTHKWMSFLYIIDICELINQRLSHCPCSELKASSRENYEHRGESLFVGIIV